tara:strand:+ start:614 stop:832 length:219 start_codon:yes stop_codon:yes gene_type:complete
MIKNDVRKFIDQLVTGDTQVLPCRFYFGPNFIRPGFIFTIPPFNYAGGILCERYHLVLVFMHFFIQAIISQF